MSDDQQTHDKTKQKQTDVGQSTGVHHEFLHDTPPCRVNM